MFARLHNAPVGATIGRPQKNLRKKRREHGGRPQKSPKKRGKAFLAFPRLFLYTVFLFFGLFFLALVPEKLVKPGLFDLEIKNKQKSHNDQHNVKKDLKHISRQNKVQNISRRQYHAN